MEENKLAQQFDFKKLMKFSVPTMVMMVFMSLYQTTDGIFVSNLVGDLGLTALNIVYPFISVVVAVAVMFTTGSSAVIALNMGLGEYRMAKENFTFIVLAATILTAIISILGLIFIRPMIDLFGATPKIYKMCYDYLVIMIISAPLCTLQILFQTFFVTSGKPRIGLFLTVLSGVANMGLDALFMGPMKMGMKGAALATSIGFTITACYGIYYFWVHRNGTLYFVRPKFRGRVLLRSCLNGSSEMVNNMSVAVTTLLFNLVGLHYLKEEGVAAISIVLYSQYVMTAVFMGYSGGVAPIFSFKYGAGDHKQIKKIFKISMIFVSVLSVIVCAMSYVLARPIGIVFASGSRSVLELSVHGFWLFAPSFLFTGMNIFVSALFTAFSNGLVSGFLSFMRTFVLLVAALLLLPYFIGAEGIWLAVPMAEGLAVVISLAFLRKASWLK